MNTKAPASALESDPGTVNSIDHEDTSEIDPDIALAMDFNEDRNNPFQTENVSEIGQTEVENATSLDEPELVVAADGSGQVQPQPAEAPGAASPGQAQPTAAQPAVDPANPGGQAPVVQQQPQVAPQSSEPPAQAPERPAVNPSEMFRLLHENIQQQQPQIEKLVADQSYQLTAEELEGIQTEPEKVLPSLMARVHVNATKVVLRHIAQQLPVVVGALTQAQAQNKGLEDQFYAKWPQLDRNADGMKVRQAAAMYRQMNPNASIEDMIEKVGSMVVVATGKQMPAPAQPGARAPAPARRAVPFVPAAPASAAPPGGSRGEQPGEWERWGMIMTADQNGAFESR